MLNLRWGVSPFRMDFSVDSAEDSIRRAFKVGLGWVGRLGALFSVLGSHRTAPPCGGQEGRLGASRQSDGQARQAVGGRTCMPVSSW